MKKIFIVLLMLIVSVGVFADAFDEVKMLSGVEVLDGPGEFTNGTKFNGISYRKSEEKGKFPVYDRYMFRAEKTGLFFVHPIMETRNIFLFTSYLPKDDNGQMYSPRRVMMFYLKPFDKVDSLQDIPYEKCYFDESGTIYVDTQYNGEVILIPVFGESFPTTED